MSFIGVRFFMQARCFYIHTNYTPGSLFFLPEGKTASPVSIYYSCCFALDSFVDTFQGIFDSTIHKSTQHLPCRRYKSQTISYSFSNNWCAYSLDNWDTGDLINCIVFAL